MTREEAKEILQGSRITSFRPNGTARVKEALDLAIEALSQPIVCKDYCIDDDHIYCSPKVAERVVEALSAEAVQGWIPVSERLPSVDGSYLVTSSFGKVYTAHFYSEHGRWQYNRRGLIEAWMPLPKPYREDGEEE